MSLRLIRDLLHNPVWFFGILAVIAGFLLQAVALGANGPLAVVQPVLIFELPLTLLLGSVIFRTRLHSREWTAILAMTIGLGGLLFFLAPTGGSSTAATPATWIIGISANLAIIAVLIMSARRLTSSRRAALLGTAAGCSFGLTAALMKAMTEAIGSGGLLAIFPTWQTYAMVAAGALAMFLLQSALNAGTLVAAQPGITTADPIIAILWGVVAFRGTVHGGLSILFSAACAAVMGWSIFELSRSPLVSGEEGADTQDRSRAANENGSTDASPGQNSSR